ncbi:MAG TPA: DUF2336 domain-containing protein [Rhodospirillaceae bacterium]|nr:DUF2336 domain-containing protein [Rhodospirillaceae bacterium]
MSGPSSYEQARDLAADPRPEIRAELAARDDVAPEILYFLAGDTVAGVRCAVAANPRTPPKGNLLLADDPEDEVRRLLAGKITLVQAASPRDRSLAGRVLDLLARDRVTRVRAVIAEALKDVADADAELIGRLARDAEILVAAPVLEHSPLLTDGDLLDVIRSNPEDGALSAISRRAYVGEEVTRAIVASGNVSAITHMLENSNAQLQESTLDALIERAAEEPNWQEPLVYRPELSERHSLRLAQAVATQLLDRILARHDLPPGTVRAIARVVKQRLETEVAAGASSAAPISGEIQDGFARLLSQARDLLHRGLLDEAKLMVALLSDEADEVVAGLSVLTGMSVPVILQIIAAQSPRALCALAWEGGLSALFAAELQIRLGRIAGSAAIQPAADGAYRLDEEEMRWQIDMFASLDGGR